VRSRAALPRAAWDDRPIAIVDGVRLRAISSAAARQRVRTGMTPAEARALCADLAVLPWDETALAHAITVVTAELLAASPQVTPARGEPGVWWVGASGFDGVGGELPLARALSSIARAHHPRARVGIADSCVAARAATWASAGHDGARSILVAPGDDRRYLAPAPLALIPMDEEVRATFAALGIRTAGGIAALDAEDVERRWGREGLHAWRLSRGEDDRRPVLARATLPRTVEAELPAPATTMEPVLWLVHAAIEQLAAGLVADGRAAAAIAITLTLDDARGALPTAQPHTVTREARLARPLARVPQLFEHCRALLERFTPGAPASAVTVSIVATAPASGEQGDLLALDWHDPAAVDAALARLRAELGPQTVVRPIARDEHRPEHRGAWIESTDETTVHTTDKTTVHGSQTDRATVHGSQTDKTTVHGSQTDATTIHESFDEDPDWPAVETSPVRIARAGLVLHGATATAPELGARRMLETPEIIEVERSGSTPVALWWNGRRWHLEHASGPERLSGDWWINAYQRDYWLCEGDGAEWMLFVTPNGAWYLQGWRD